MDETIRIPNPEETKRLQDERDAELEQYFADLEKSKVLVTLREAGPEIAEFETMIASFRLAHSLEFLNKIGDISPQLAIVFEFTKEISLTLEELDYSLRHVTLSEPKYAENQRRSIAAAKTIDLSLEDKVIYNKRTTAKKDLEDIIKKLNKLKGSQDYEKLKAEYSLFAKAVGSISRGSNKVSHS
jgi:hypothetical protein